MKTPGRNGEAIIVGIIFGIISVVGLVTVEVIAMDVAGVAVASVLLR